MALALALLAATPTGVSVVDDSARTVTLTTVARRVVTLAPHTTELLAEVGAFDQLVAVSAYSDYPPAALHLPIIGSAFGLDVEAIAALHPDLVVAWTSGNSTSQVEAIERLGIPVYRSDPRDLEQIASSLERLGVLTGHETEGRERARAFRTTIADLRTRYGARPPVRVFYQVWDQPLMTVGGTHLISRVISLCGGQNVFETLAAAVPTVDREAVIAADPEVIVLASDADDAPSGLASWQAWPQISAVRSHRLIALPAEHIARATTRIAEGATTLCTVLENARH